MFTCCHLCVPGSHPGHGVHFIIASLGSSGQWRFPQLLLVLVTWWFLTILVWCFADCPPVLDFVWWFSHDCSEVTGLWEAEHRGECHFHPLSRVPPITMAYDCWWWPWSPGKVVFVRILHSQVISLPCQYWTLRKGVTRHSPHLRSEKLCLGGSICILYLNYSAQNYFICIYSLCNHLFIQVWTHRHLFYTLGYNPVSFFCCSNYSSLGHWELFQSAPTSPSVIFWALPYFLAFQVHLVYFLLSPRSSRFPRSPARGEW